MSDNEEYNYTNSLNLLVAFLIISIGVFGVICNSAIVYIYLKENSEKTAFNLICFFRAISNVIILTNVFIITFFPKTMLGFSPYPPVIESWLINTSNTLYLGNEYQIVLVALNRFCALFFPMKYSKVFSVFNTTIVLVAIYIYRIVKKIIELWPQSMKGCHALYSTKSLAWSYSDAEECSDWQDDALVVIFYTFIAMSVLNTITFVKILHFYGKRSSDQDKDTRKRMRKNTIHFLQTMLQDSLYLVDLTFTFELSSWSTHRVWTYVSGTLIWELLHTTDGPPWLFGNSFSDPLLLPVPHDSYIILYQNFDLIKCIIGVFGAICNYTIVHVFIVSPDKTSFNLICFFRALINLYILVTTFLGVFLPSTLLGYSVYSDAFESWNLNLSMSLYLGNEYQITLVALNRFCALFFPRYYTKIFAIRPTLFVIIVFYVYRLAVVIYMTAVDVARGCFYFFSTITLAWQYPFDPVCWFEDNIMIIVLTTFIGTTCLNMVTFVRILKFYRSMNTHDRDTRTRVRKNAMLFFQTVLQDSLYIIDLSFTFKLGALSTHRMWTFISGTLVWESLHALDGFIMLMFNDRFSFLCARNESPETSTSAAPRRAPVHPLGSQVEITDCDNVEAGPNTYPLYHLQKNNRKLSNKIRPQIIINGPEN